MIRPPLLSVLAAALVLLPVLWPAHPAPIVMSGAMFSAAGVGLALCLACFSQSGWRLTAGLHWLALALVSLVGAISLQYAAGQLAFAAQWLQPVATITLAAAVAYAVAGLLPDRRRQAAQGLALGLVLAGVWNTGVALVQFINLDGLFDCCMAVQFGTGYGSGNFLQRNHLASLLVWGGLAVLFLQAEHRLRPAHARALLIVLAAGVALSGSRAGLLEWVVLTALVGAAARWLRAPVPGQAATAAPASGAPAGTGLDPRLALFGLLTCLAWWAVLKLGAVIGGFAWEFGDVIERSSATGPSYRLHEWRQALELIGQHPWGGAGWGQLGYALLVGPLGAVPLEQVNNAHNLALQLIVELGLPLGGAAVVLLGVFLGVRLWSLIRDPGPEPAQQHRPAWFGLLGIVTIGVHSLVEYPLWSVHFLIPCAVFCGLLGGTLAAVEPATTIHRATQRRWRVLGATLSVLTGLGGLVLAHAVHDYALVHRAFSPRFGDSREVIQEAARRSVWFAPPALFAELSITPFDREHLEQGHAIAGRVLKVQAEPSVLLREIVYAESRGETAAADRYTRYMASALYRITDADKALHLAAARFQLPGLRDRAATWQEVRRQRLALDPNLAASR